MLTIEIRGTNDENDSFIIWCLFIYTIENCAIQYDPSGIGEEERISK